METRNKGEGLREEPLGKRDEVFLELQRASNGGSRVGRALPFLELERERERDE